jgi:hypothetical protein
MESFGPISKRIISDVNYARGVELVKECGTGFTLGDAGHARRKANVERYRGAKGRGARAYWLGVARELRTRRDPELDKTAAILNVELPASRPSGTLDAICAEGCNPADCPHSDRELTSLDVAPFSDDPDAERCRHCGTRADWHDGSTGACPDDDAPHPYSVAADALSSADPWDAAPLAVARAIHNDMLAGKLTYGAALYVADSRGVGDSFYLVRMERAGMAPVR